MPPPLHYFGTDLCAASGEQMQAILWSTLVAGTLDIEAAILLPARGRLSRHRRAIGWPPPG